MTGSVGIVDYGMGNLCSVFNAVETLGFTAVVCQTPESLRDVDRIILPGVGSFDACMDNLHRSGFVKELLAQVRTEGKPLMGICLGMQALAEFGHEGASDTPGLGLIHGQVVRLNPGDSRYKIPHVGWHDTHYSAASPLFQGLPASPDLYFVHSYHFECTNPGDVDATFELGRLYTAAVRRGNVFGTQFHPEKSQEFGLKILANFLSWQPEVSLN